MGNLQLVKDYSRELWDNKDVSAIDRYFAKDVIIQSPIKITKGFHEMKEIMLHWLRAFPSLKVHWDEFICEDNKVVSRWRAEGLHEGDFLKYSATNKHVRYSGVTIYSIRNSKIVEYWALVDMYSIVNQIMEIPPIGNQSEFS